MSTLGSRGSRQPDLPASGSRFVEGGCYSCCDYYDYIYNYDDYCIYQYESDSWVGLVRILILVLVLVLILELVS